MKLCEACVQQGYLFPNYLAFGGVLVLINVCLFKIYFGNV